MFGSLVKTLQSLSPLGSPVTSPAASPRASRRRREVQSDPEADDGDRGKKTSRPRRPLDKRRAGKRPHIGDPVPLRGSKSLGRLDGLKEVQRLAQYEQYFQALLSETRHDSPDHEDLSRAKAKVKQALKRGQEESDLERIQDLFPNDFLRLYDKDVYTMKMKSLIRKRSTTAARLQRALSAKGAREDEVKEQSPAPRPGQPKRQFLMEAPVTFTSGVQSQERHLFLFNDLLLVAKARSGGSFKLKDKVRASEMWLTRCAMEDVVEVNKSLETSFVVGWPTTNVVATFSTQAARDLWWSKLTEVVSAERDKEPRSTNIQVVFFDTATSIEYCKTFSVGPEETARACIRLALEHLEMRGLDADDYQLWAATGRDEAPYPLIGHERPFAIKLSSLREGLSTEEGFDLDHCNNVHGPGPLAKCQFILRSKRKTSECTVNMETKKASKKSRKSPMRIRQVFRRSLSKGEDCVDCSAGLLFGIPLAKLCDGDNLPRPVMAMLREVFAKGPFTQGIFRKSANARLVRELRDKLDSGEEVALEHVPVLATAALLKEFLRSLPDPLLGGALYPAWMEALECPDEQERLLRVRSVLDQLPRPNQLLLQHFLCVLHHVARGAAHTLMPAGNLGVCVGPSLLWGGPAPLGSRAVPALVELLVARCELLCGPHVPCLLGAAPERDPARRDSGAEESDSLHSGGLRRDDSSIDSLERELMEPCPPPRKDKMSLSRDSGLTMSDSFTPDEEESGSTSSGSGRALYPPPQPARYEHGQVTSSYSVPAATSTPNCHQTREQTLPGIAGAPTTREYVRVYGGWEERVQECCRNMSSDDSVYARPQNGQGAINSNFQRQDWFRQRSHLKRLNSGGTSSGSSSKSSHHTSGSSSGSASSGVGGLHQHSYRSSGPSGLMRRSASEESLLNSVNELHSYDDEDGVGVKKPALHRKGKAPLPPPPTNATSLLEVRDNYTCYKPATPISRSKSAHHLHMDLDVPNPYAKKDVNFSRQDTDVLGDNSGHVVRPHRSGHRKAARSSTDDWSRSRSTPHIATAMLEEVDRSYDSSTLSDDDSTPHVSRSNSRGKDCAAANSAWESAYGTAQTELLVHAAPVNIEESCSDSDPSPHVSGIPAAPTTPAHHRKLGTIVPPSFAQDTSAPPLPPKRSSAEVKLRHLPPVHVDAPPRTQATRPQSSYISGEETMAWESSDTQTPRKPPERRGRHRQRGSNPRSSQRSKSLPPPPGESVTAEDEDKPSEERNHPQNLHGEISWSVSQLRSLFTTSGGRPPPYRPPPSVIPSYRAPITSYHLGNSQSERYVVSRRLLLDSGPRLRVDSTEEEESYV
ncbi:uncharacterized protein LOC134542613 isoform X2 [Bacillus rossius redtenbacheri]|uniref:uncharacterized protein LOC134542613 isoform X2 n=1 Tax=Bacillus rossius redtenbacheri TaxID=93214 RepID=UPI002FDD2B69